MTSLLIKIIRTGCLIFCAEKPTQVESLSAANGILHSHVFRKIPFIITNKMQRYTIFFIAVDALRVSGGFSAHHQELKLYTHAVSGFLTLCMLPYVAQTKSGRLCSPLLVCATYDSIQSVRKPETACVYSLSSWW
jgi:hypothetical protein